MIFRTGGKDYRGATAVEIAHALERDATDYPYPGQTIRQFLLWSLDRLQDHVPPRELSIWRAAQGYAAAGPFTCRTLLIGVHPSSHGNELFLHAINGDDI